MDMCAPAAQQAHGLITGAQAPHSAGRWHGNRLLHTGSPWLDGCHHMHTHGAPSKDRVTETPTFRNPSQGHRLGSRNLHDHATGDVGRHIGSPNSVSSPVTYGGGGGCHTEERRLRYADLGQRNAMDGPNQASDRRATILVFGEAAQEYSAAFLRLQPSAWFCLNSGSVGAIRRITCCSSDNDVPAETAVLQLPHGREIGTVWGELWGFEDAGTYWSAWAALVRTE
jgi:hypothetical protein